MKVLHSPYTMSNASRGQEVLTRAAFTWGVVPIVPLSVRPVNDSRLECGGRADDDMRTGSAKFRGPCLLPQLVQAA